MIYIVYVSDCCLANIDVSFNDISYFMETKYNANLLNLFWLHPSLERDDQNFILDDKYMFSRKRNRILQKFIKEQTDTDISYFIYLPRHSKKPRNKHHYSNLFGISTSSIEILKLDIVAHASIDNLLVNSGLKDKKAHFDEVVYVTKSDSIYSKLSANKSINIIVSNIYNEIAGEDIKLDITTLANKLYNTSYTFSINLDKEYKDLKNKMYEISKFLVR